MRPDEIAAERAKKVRLTELDRLREESARRTRELEIKVKRAWRNYALASVGFAVTLVLTVWLAIDILVRLAK